MQGCNVEFARQFVRGLNQLQRNVLMLHYAECLTTPEISAVLNLSAQRVQEILDYVRRETKSALEQAKLALA